MSFLPLLACRHCGTVVRRSLLPVKAAASCPRCDSTLYRASSLSLNDWIALGLSAAIVFVIANTFPIVTLTLQGSTVHATMMYALFLTWQQGHEFTATMCALFGVVFPFGQICFLLWALLAIKKRQLPADFRYGLRVLHNLTPWSMIPVLALGILVALVKLAGMASVHIGPGIFAFSALVVLMTIMGRLSAQRLWAFAEDAGLVSISGANCQPGQLLTDCESCAYVQVQAPSLQRCGRCAAPIHRRKPASHTRVWAFLIAAAILYIPANVLPVMSIRLPTGTSSHTIIGGINELWSMGSWGLAIIVFIASVMVPITKLLALSFLMLNAHWRGSRVQRQRTRLYQLVEFVGQWSMLDVFVVLLLAAMANFPGLSQVMAADGAAAFGAVVVLTMLAAMSYDPRMGWDAEFSDAGRVSRRGRPDSSSGGLVDPSQSPCTAGR